jgi:hypothetical protein
MNKQATVRLHRGLPHFVDIHFKIGSISSIFERKG